MEYKFKGSNYEVTKELGSREIVKIVRTNVRSMAKDFTKQTGMKLKFSVKGEWFAGGWSIRIELIDCSESPYTGNKQLNGRLEVKPELAQLLKDIEQMAQSYNYDDSDSMTDYFHVRFYDGHPKLNWELENKFTEGVN